MNETEDARLTTAYESGWDKGREEFGIVEGTGSFPHVVLDSCERCALLMRKHTQESYIVAYGYDSETGSWSQGSYHASLTDAMSEFAEARSNELRNVSDRELALAQNCFRANLILAELPQGSIDDARYVVVSATLDQSERVWLGAPTLSVAFIDRDEYTDQDLLKMFTQRYEPLFGKLEAGTSISQVYEVPLKELHEQYGCGEWTDAQEIIQRTCSPRRIASVNKRIEDARTAVDALAERSPATQRETRLAAKTR